MATKKIDKLTDKEFMQLVAESSSLRELFVKVGYSVTGYTAGGEACKARMEKLGVSIDTTTSYDYLRIPSEELYSKGEPRGALRQRVIKDKIMAYQCDTCGNTGEWNGKELTLQLDHIDGDAGNNEKENLRWQCPNCHTQTDTYGNKNTTKSRRPAKYNHEAVCTNCFKTYHPNSRTQRTCSVSCSIEKRKKQLPISKDDLKSKLYTTSFEAVGREFNVSGNAVKKWCIRYGIPSKASDYK